METKHTPTPWAIDSDLPPNDRPVIIRVGEIPISANMHGPQIEGDHANAEFIVRACNSHDAMLAALKKMIEEEDNHGGLNTAPNRDEIWQAARAAIAKAEGESHE